MLTLPPSMIDDICRLTLAYFTDHDSGDDMTDSTPASADDSVHTGGCLCGAVRYRVHGPLRDVVNCHCSQCLRSHGHYAAYTAALRDDVELIGQRGLHWYASSDSAERGFCRECGASLFWRPLGKSTISIAAGTLDRPTGLTSVRHIFTADAGDYYRIDDDLEQLPRGMG
jgi:hypothetical protein